MASITLLLPQPLGPTTAVIPAGKSMTAFSKKDLKPEISIFLSFINGDLLRAWIESESRLPAVVLTPGPSGGSLQQIDTVVY
jgi:hypothetical protein